jgi:hypothetical protein
MGLLAGIACGGYNLRLPPSAIVLLYALVLSAANLFASPIKQGKEVIFFPTAARLSEDLGHWIVLIHAWVFERESDSLWRRVTSEILPAERYQTAFAGLPVSLWTIIIDPAVISP